MKHLFRQLIKKLSIRDEAQKVLVGGAGSSFIIKIIGAGLAFGVHVVLARLLGVSDYGAYIYIYSWVTVLVIPVRLGFDNSLVRFIPEYKNAEMWGHLKGILSFAYISVTIAGLIVALLLTTAALFIEGFVADYSKAMIVLAAAAIPLLSLINITKGTLRGFKKVASALVPNAIITHLAIGFGTLALYYLGGYSVGAEDAMAATVVSFGIALGTGILFLRKELPAVLRSAVSVNKNKYWLSVTVPMLLITGMYIILKRTDLIMVGILIDEEAAGVYGAVSKISDLVVFGLQAVNIIAAPLIAELYHQRKKEQLQSLITLATRGAFTLSFIVSMGFIFGGDWVLSLFGSSFTTGYYALLILLVAQMGNAFSGSVGLIMLMTGHQNMAAKILAVSALLNIVLNFILIPLWGIEGGAVATGISMIVWNLSMVYYVFKKLDINSTIF